MVKAVTANKMAEQALLAAQDLMVEAPAVQMATQVVLQEYAAAVVARDGTAVRRITVAAASPGQRYTVIQLASEAVAAAMQTFKEGSVAAAATMAAVEAAVTAPKTAHCRRDAAHQSDQAAT